MFDAQGTVVGDLADLVRRHVVLSRNIENASKFCGRDGNDGAGAAFAKEKGFGGGSLIEADVCGETGHSRRRTGLKTGHYRGETGFGEGDGEAGVGNVVGGLEGALGGESDEAILETLLGSEVDAGRFAGNDAAYRFGIFGGGEFAGGIGDGKSRFLASLGMTV